VDSLELREVKEVQAKCLVPANRECIKTDLATCIQEREGVRIEVKARGAERDTDELKSEHLTCINLTNGKLQAKIWKLCL